MAKEIDLRWKTDRRDLSEAVRILPAKSVVKMLNAHMKQDPRAAGLRTMRHEQQANLLMLGLLEGKVPESDVLPCGK